jgi:hypothetical protein
VEDIMLLRKYSSAFRKKIQTYIDKHLINGTVPTAVIKEDCHSISKEYCDEINSRIASQISKKGLGISLLMDIASIWIIPVTLYNIGQKLWDSVFHKDQRGFVMYLTTLKNIV